MFHLFLCGGFGYVSGLSLHFPNPSIKRDALRRPLCQTLGLWLKTIELGAALVLARRASFLGLFWRLGLVVLARLAVSGNNRSVRFRHALVGFVALAGSG